MILVASKMVDAFTESTLPMLCHAITMYMVVPP